MHTLFVVVSMSGTMIQSMINWTQPETVNYMAMQKLHNYASVGGAPEAYGSRRARVCVCVVCVCVYVFHAHFSATAKN